jgi:outer membrane cobalamin receptor
MKINLLKTFILFILTFSYLYPQATPLKSERGRIFGKVFDYDSKHSIEYANIVVLSIFDSSLVNGTISDVDGNFILNDLEFGKYLLEVRFIGFDTKSFSIEINSENTNINLGDIYIKPHVLELDNVVVEGDRSPISYQIDKKVIDVDKIQTVISGTAADVLQNVPSVTVDIEGNVSLRGSSNFTVLIDGRPSILSAQDALQQIPASSIDNIELITNPSAKYDPEGTAGIINIILKKNQNLGTSGIINANAGLNEKYGGDFLFQHKTPDLTYTVGMDYNQRAYPGTRNEENIFYSSNSTSYLNSVGSMKWGRTGFGIRAGVEFNTSDNNYFNIVARYGTREGNQSSNSIFTNWTNIDPNISSYQSLGQRYRKGKFGGTNLTYIHKFEGKGHEIKGEFNFRYNDGDEATLTESLQNSISINGKRTNEFGPSRDFETKIDYTLPFTETRIFEAGYENEIENSDDINELYELNSNTGSYEFQSLFSNYTKYLTNDQAVYATYSDQFGDFGIQGGLRAEYTFRTIRLLKDNNEFKIDRIDFFPTLHSSYKFSKGTQLMASYTRRIQRPRGWELEPFLTWMDANNVRIGNPALLPELIDSYETGIQTYLGEVSISTELYHRFTVNRIDRIKSIYQDDITLNSVENIGKDYATGSELMFIFDPTDFWSLNTMANIYNYRIDGVINQKSFSRESFNWNARINNMFKISSSTQLQLNLNYNSPSVSSQGTSEGYISTDVSMKQDLFERMLSITLQVRDLFGTVKYENRSSGTDFYQYNYFQRESPMVILNLRFNFNNYKTKRDNGSMENPNGVGEDF